MTVRLRLALIALVLLTQPVLAVLPAVPGAPSLIGASVALADDDDGEGDDDDDDRPARFERDDDDDDDRRRAPPRRAAVTLPARAANQVIVRAADSSAVGGLVSQGFSVLAAEGTLTLLQVPDGVGVDAAVALAQSIAGVIAAPNDFYRSQAAPCRAEICRHWQAVGLTSSACNVTLPIGVIDTGLNLEHDMLSGSLVTLERAGGDAAASGERHGTAVVAMLAGRGDSRVPGLLPKAPIMVIDPFTAGGGDERADAFGLISALDRLVARGIRVINLSLAGPDNALLAAAVIDAETAGAVLVAAAGNAGPQAAPLYPAAYDTVVAVTALDTRNRVYRRAAQGAHIDLAAPGVSIPTAASVSGVRPQTGTSFATPFVTAAVAAALAVTPDDTPQAVRDGLAATATDLGLPGRDDMFGWGLVQIGEGCGPAL